jgi:hypothetical protein
MTRSTCGRFCWFSEASPVGDDWQPSAAQEERHADLMGTVDFKAMSDCRTPANDR